MIGAQVDHIRIRIFADNSLPVELLYFQGKQVDHCAELTWKTASEYNNDYFTIEKMIDGQFSAIATINSHSSTTTQESEYVYRDCETEEFNYYRLLQTDLDGTKEFISDIILVNMDLTKDESIQVFPNPSSDFIVVRSKESMQSIYVYDLQGNRLQNYQLTDMNCKQQVLELDGMQPGLFIVAIQTAIGVSNFTVEWSSKN